MRTSEVNGQSRHRILEIYFIDRDPEIGGLFKQLLAL
jgi:hypothetical protein